MNQYEILNQCLEILKNSEIDLLEKLRIENLLIQIKMHLLVDIHKQEIMPEVFHLDNFEDLLIRVKVVCGPESTSDDVEHLMDQVKRMYSAMAACLSE